MMTIDDIVDEIIKSYCDSFNHFDENLLDGVLMDVYSIHRDFSINDKIEIWNVVCNLLKNKV